MCETLIFAAMKRHLLIAFCLLMAMSGFAQNIDSLFNVYENAPRRDKLATARPLVSALLEDGTLKEQDTINWESDLDYFAAKLYNAMSFYCYNHGDYIKTMYYAEQSLPLVPADSTEMLDSFYSIISVIAFYQGDNEKALKACEHRLAILADDDVEGRASVCNTMAAIYSEIADLTPRWEDMEVESNFMEQALHFSEEAVRLRRELGNDEKGLLAAFLGKQSEILSYLNRAEEALAVVEEAAALDLEAGRMGRYYLRLGQKGHALFNLERYEEAREAYLECMEHTDKETHLASYRSIISQLGCIEEMLGNMPEAIAYFEEVIRLNEGASLFNNIDIYKQLSVCYKDIDPKKAYDYVVKQFNVSDSLRNSEVKTLMADLQVKYETAEKEREIAEQQSEIKRRGLLMRVWIIIAVVLIIGLVVIAWFAGRYRRRGRELQRLNETRSRLFSIITHDLKTPVVAQNQVLHAINKSLDVLPHDELKEQCQLLTDTSDALKEQLLNLVQWARTETGKMNIEPVNFCLADEVAACLRQLKGSLDAKHINMEVQVPDDLIVHADRNVVAVVLRNLVSNAVKFSYEGGTVAIDISDDGSHCWLSVTDHGVGISPSKLEQIFHFTVRSSAGTAGESGTGLGLYVSKLMMDKAGCDMKVESTEGQGSTFSFSVPKE